MTATETIIEILLGGILGTIGQGIRVIVGLKKLTTDNKARKTTGQDIEPFNKSRLFITLLIGFIAGALALIIKGLPADNGSRGFLLAIIAAGYSGTDFIEGAFQKAQTK